MEQLSTFLYTVPHPPRYIGRSKQGKFTARVCVSYLARHEVFNAILYESKDCNVYELKLLCIIFNIEIFLDIASASNKKINNADVKFHKANHLLLDVTYRSCLCARVNRCVIKMCLRAYFQIKCRNVNDLVTKIAASNKKVI